MRVLLGGWVLVIGVAVACSSTYPSAICDARATTARLATPALDLACTSCVEARCCDLTGRCQASDECRRELASTQSCVLDAGRSAGAAEHLCIGGLADVGASTAYRCMHDQCGTQCGLPVCVLDPAVPTVVSGRCESCFGASCCTEMNACTQNRKCRGALDCFFARCKGELPGSLDPAGSAAARAQRDLLCGGNASAANSCLARCLAEFAPSSDTSADAVAARCLAANVGVCAAEISCGSACRDDVSDAGDGGNSLR